MKNLNTLNQRFQKAETRTIVEREREKERIKHFSMFYSFC
jgi:hypothetical protein